MVLISVPATHAHDFEMQFTRDTVGSAGSALPPLESFQGGVSGCL